MSVIIGRALPDVRDGLKPAHRRVVYGMRLMGLASNRAVPEVRQDRGEVMGNFHPHGDASIYDTLVRLAQGFNMRYPLVDGQGNFGSVDGDPPAAMRYTEARLQPISDDLMADLDKETVDFVANYDETTEEPTVLPTPYPNLLVNGSAGIAVGMATNIPPHNLQEVIDGIVWIIDHREESDGDKRRGLRARISGPDFPRRVHRGACGHRCSLPDRPRIPDGTGSGRDRGHPEGGTPGDRHHRDSLPAQQDPSDREDRRAGPGQVPRRASATCATSRTARACGSSSS